MRLAKNGRFAPMRRSVSSGSGPPSISIVAPSGDSTRIASPWPMSSTVRWRSPSGREAIEIASSTATSAAPTGSGLTT